MAHAQKPDFVFRRNGRVHLNRRGRQFNSTAGSRVVCISVSNTGYATFRGSVRVLATHSIRQFPLQSPSRASPCAIRFQARSTMLLRIELIFCVAGKTRFATIVVAKRIWSCLVMAGALFPFTVVSSVLWFCDCLFSYIGAWRWPLTPF